MSFINFETRDIQLKVVFYGPEGSGKTAMLQHIYEKTRPADEPMLNLPKPNTGSSSDAYYDLLPIKLGDIRGFSTHINLWTVPGATPYRDARHSILEGVDGVVFVADSRPAHMAANMKSIDELTLALRAHSFDPAKIPLVVACSHADAPDAMSPEVVARSLLQTHPEPNSVPVHGVHAPEGYGVFDSLKAVSKLVLSELKKNAG